MDFLQDMMLLSISEVDEAKKLLLPKEVEVRVGGRRVHVFISEDIEVFF